MLIRVNDWGRNDARREYAQFWKEMFPAVVVVVEASFINAGMENPTQAEVKARIDMTKKIVDQMRQDLKWSKTRIKDHLMAAIEAKLDGRELDLQALDRRGGWVAGQ